MLFMFACVCAVLWPNPARSACIQGRLSAQPPPQITFLRSYRGSFAVPARLAIDSADNVFVADSVKGEVVVRRSDGSIESRKTGLGYTISIAVDQQGRIYVGDAIKGRITVFDGSWQELFALGQGDGEFLLPNDIAIEPLSGRAYVTDSKAHVVKVYGADGSWLFAFGGLGFDDGQFNFPAGIVVSETAGEILVTDQLNSRVQIFDFNGNFRFCFGRRGTTVGRFNLPQGLWVDSSGRIFVADSFDGRVQVLERDGDSQGFIGAFGVKPGETRVPVDIVIDSSNRMFLASANNGRLEVFGVDQFTDPEAILPAVATISPDPLVRGCVQDVVVVHVEVAGYELGLIDPATVTANGVAASSVAATAADVDGDTVPDLRVEFDRAALLQTMPSSGDVVVPVVISGQLADKIFEAIPEVSLTDAPDTDADGICDEADTCASTPAGEVTDAVGCTIDQHCPCKEAAPGEPWARRSRYVSCVRHVTRDFVRADLIDYATRRSRVSEAKDSGCGGICPETVLPDLASVWGCIDRLCPCKGPALGEPWKNHRRYQRCVWRRAGEAKRAGLMSLAAKYSTVATAKQSTCGVSESP